MSVNILLADDHLMVREGLKQVLELDHDIDVISEASDGYECLNLINKTHPDVYGQNTMPSTVYNMFKEGDIR